MKKTQVFILIDYTLFKQEMNVKFIKYDTNLLNNNTNIINCDTNIVNGDKDIVNYIKKYCKL